jgi:hypothetical protein
MKSELLDDMKRYVGFDEADAEALTELRRPLADFFPGVVDVFYTALRKHPRA